MMSFAMYKTERVFNTRVKARSKGATVIFLLKMGQAG